MLVFVPQLLSPLEKYDHVVFQVSIEFLTNSKREAFFHCIAYDYSYADWDELHSNLKDVPWEDIFILGAFAAASEFCEWVQIGIDEYILHQVKPHSSPWFLATGAAAISHRTIFFFIFTNRISSNCWKRVLEAAKLAHAKKTKESITSQKLGSRDFWIIADSVLNKVKFIMPPLFNGLKVFSSASDKVILFAKTFLRVCLNESQDGITSGRG